MRSALDADTRYVSFDLETTGLSPRSDRIIEVGAVKFTERGVVDTFSSLADPGVALPLTVQRLCGLSDRDLKGQPAPRELVAQLAAFSEGCLLVGHGVAFDLAFCAELLPQAFARREAIDTSELARTFLPRALSHSLELLSREMGLDHDRPHRALSDADTARLLLLRLVEEVRGYPPPLQARIRWMCQDSGWPGGEFIAAHLEGSGPAPSSPLEVPPAPDPRPAPGPPAGPARLDPGEISSAFEANGAMAAADPGFELREEQQQMALAVTQAFNRDKHLLVEAGTGVGKSLAYLLPAREWAHRTGERVVISTHTITLQEQLLANDLPALEAARPLPVTAAVLKGRGNYVSLRRLERWLQRAPLGRRRDLDELRFQVRSVVWAEQTTTGDRSELRLAGRDPEFWEMVGSTVDDCLGPACHNWRDRRCFMARARLQAREADLVIVNHALLLADADSGGAVLPESRRLVVDEAHHLEEAATQAQARRLGPGSVISVIDRLPDLGAGSLATSLRAARQATLTAFSELRQLLEERAGSTGGRFPVVLDRRVAEIPSWAGCASGLERASRSLQRAASGLRQLPGQRPVQELLWPQPDNADRECELAAEALQSAAALMAAALEAVTAPGEGTVVWVEFESRGRPALRSAPVEIGSALSERLFSRLDTAILTSATLAVAGSFQYVKERLGLEQVEELVLASPFDYLRQSLLCLPRGIPGHNDPRHPQVVARLAGEVAGELGGRTLVLFTGYAALKEVAAQLRQQLSGRGIAVLGQGLDGTRNQLLRSFRQNPRTVLLGTNSFWEGIDLPGDLLRCVIIDKLPFPVPSDPIFQARSRGLPDSFARLSLPEAVLRLKQGFGRLVRGRDDAGAVVICDPRIQERRYGESFVAALPRATVSDEPAEGVAAAVGLFLRGRERAGSPAAPRPL